MFLFLPVFLSLDVAAYLDVDLAVSMAVDMHLFVNLLPAVVIAVTIFLSLDLFLSLAQYLVIYLDVSLDIEPDLSLYMNLDWDMALSQTLDVAPSQPLYVALALFAAGFLDYVALDMTLALNKPISSSLVSLMGDEGCMQATWNLSKVGLLRRWTQV